MGDRKTRAIGPSPKGKLIQKGLDQASAAPDLVLRSKFVDEKRTEEEDEGREAREEVEEETKKQEIEEGREEQGGGKGV